MTMKKFLTLLLATTFALALACGKGKEVSHAEDEGEDDQEPQTITAAAEGGTTAAPAAAAAPVVADAGTLTGLVKFESAPPAMPAIRMNADPFCQSQHPTPAKDEEVIVGPAGELANVIVFVENAPAAPAPSTPALLDQKGCQYVPHVQAVQAGQSIQIKNSDATLHNVHAMPVVNSAFNEGQPVPMTTTKKFDKPELTPFKIKCDVHGWMKSYMVVLPHPYHGVSGTNGTFNIGNLPPGNYTIVAWHEKYGQQKQQNITVGPKETKTVNFTFKG
jgi:plastocyanin